MKGLLYTGLLAMCMSLFVACTKEDENPDFDTSKTGTMTVNFDNRVGSQEVMLDSTMYQTATGEDYSISKLKYYISNIVLTTEKGSVYTVPQNESYFLIDEEDMNSQEISLTVPSGNYASIQFMIGVDSMRNTADLSQRTGVLDIAGRAEDMYWTWNSGYIFFKMEGESPDLPMDTSSMMGMGQMYMYHIGGYGGYDSPTINNVKTKTLTFDGEIAEVRTDMSPEVHLTMDAAKIFSGSTNFGLNDYRMVMFSDFSTSIANNYINAFAFDHIHQ